ncbi:hypothetical protein GHK86_15960, partial [Acidimicrobiaceae bacterium USS-CC1]|nr:hypothetical protein [Acidiferrimicrobium australe]
MTTATNGNSVPTAPEATLGVAVLGAGRIAGIHARSLQAAPGVRVVGVADPDRAAAERLATVLGTRPHARWEALLEQDGVDAVMICSASSAHAEQVVAA